MERKFNRRLLTSYIKREIRISRFGRVVTTKKCTIKRDARAESVVVLLITTIIAFLTSTFPSPSSESSGHYSATVTVAPL